MNSFFHYTTFFVLLGGIGIYLANRKVALATGRQRWLKFFTYIVIVNCVIASISLDCLYIVALIIASVGLWEVSRILPQMSNLAFRATTLGIYSMIVAGFIYFTIAAGRSFLLFVYLQIIAFDGFCQIVGQLLGRHKLVPKISPGKTIEGLIGGTLFSLLSALLAQNLVAFSMLQVLLMGLFTTIFAFTGDILASYLKRLCHVKDYSNLLPGQGGVLDRFDSLIMTGFGYTLLFFTGVPIGR